MADEFLSQFNFSVYLTVSGFGGDEKLAQDSKGAFSEVSGLEYNLEMKAIREGGYNTGERQLVGKTSHTPLILKRGMTRDGAFWDWVQRCTNGVFPLPYISGSLEVFSAYSDRNASQSATWHFVNGIVTKVKAAYLNATDSSTVPIEELHIAHEGLVRVPT